MNGIRIVITGMEAGRCMACEKDAECYRIEAEGRLAGLLCPADLRRTAKVFLASANGTPAATQGGAAEAK